jgi:hypothetical protein
MSIVNFINGTEQQKDWFIEAAEYAWPGLDGVGSGARPFSRLIHNCQVRLDVVWVEDPGPAGTKESAVTTTWYDELGMRARIELAAGLDDPSSIYYDGGKAYYQEVVLHEIGHIAAQRFIVANGRTGDVVNMMRPRSSWVTSVPVTTAWVRSVEETSCEMLKDSLAAAGKRKYWNRTNQRLIMTTPPPYFSPPAWRAFCDVFDRGDVGTPIIPTLSPGAVIPYVEPVTIYFNPYYGQHGNSAILFHTTHLATYDSEGVEISHGTGGPSLSVIDPGTGLNGFNSANCGCQINLYEYDRLPITCRTWLSGFVAGTDPLETFDNMPIDGEIRVFYQYPINPMRHGSSYAPFPYATPHGTADIVVRAEEAA